MKICRTISPIVLLTYLYFPIQFGVTGQGAASLSIWIQGSKVNRIDGIYKGMSIFTWVGGMSVGFSSRPFNRTVNSLPIMSCIAHR